MQQALQNLEVESLSEQFEESYGDYCLTIHQNKGMEEAWLSIITHLKHGNNYERAIFALSRMETEIHNEQKVSARFPTRTRRAAEQSLSSILECTALARSML